MNYPKSGPITQIYSIYSGKRGRKFKDIGRSGAACEMPCLIRPGRCGLLARAGGFSDSG